MGAIIHQDSASPPFGWRESQDGRQYAEATIGDLPATTTVKRGDAGLMRYLNGGPVFRLTDQATATPTRQFPCVVTDIQEKGQRSDDGSGKKGDGVTVLLTGAITTRARNSFTTTSNKLIVATAGRLNTTTGTTPNDITFGVVIDGGATNSRTHNMFLAGVALDRA